MHSLFAANHQTLVLAEFCLKVRIIFLSARIVSKNVLLSPSKLKLNTTKIITKMFFLPILSHQKSLNTSNQYVVSQDYAKQVLSVAIYNHYKFLDYREIQK